MSTDHRPSFVELTRADAIALLQRNHFGRLAFARHDQVDIEPISYVFDQEWLYARTALGAKLNAVQHQPWVAFEVDEVKGRFEWESVVVRGTIYFLSSILGEPANEAYETALRLLQAVDPHALTSTDPTPHRQVVFRIHAREITGRRATP